jgi:hypothetical protein
MVDHLTAAAEPRKEATMSKARKARARLERRQKIYDAIKAIGSGPKPTDKKVWIGSMSEAMYHRPGSTKK